MTGGELERRSRRVHRQITMQAWTEMALIAVLAGGARSRSCSSTMPAGTRSLALGAYGFIGAMWWNNRLSEGRWERLREWIDREHAETRRLARTGAL